MPIAGLGLHVVIAICFAIHAVRSGQDRYWLFILFAFPLIGSLVYAVAIWLPELRHSRHGRQVVRGVRSMLDPSRELREAQDAFEVSENTDNRLRLADALVAAGNPAQAIPHYQAALCGVHRDDPDIQVRLARALLEAGHAADARDTLDALIRTRPDYKSPDGHLVYARAVAACGDRARARNEFEMLIGHYAGFEPRARYAEALAQWGDTAEAQVLCERSLREATRLPAYSRRLNQAWIDRIKRLIATLSAAA